MQHSSSSQSPEPPQLLPTCLVGGWLIYVVINFPLPKTGWYPPMLEILAFDGLEVDEMQLDFSRIMNSNECIYIHAPDAPT